MEHIKVLEAKLHQLVELVKELKKENAALAKDNISLEKAKKSLEKKAEELELSALNGKEEVEEEKALTKEVVDELIKSIDSLVGSEELA